jgi:hypothetical protein
MESGLKHLKIYKIERKLKKSLNQYNKNKKSLSMETNLCTEYNGIYIKSFSSQRDKCKIENILDEDRRVIVKK